MTIASFSFTGPIDNSLQLTKLNIIRHACYKNSIRYHGVKFIMQQD